MKTTLLAIAFLAAGLVSAGDDDAKTKEIVKRLGEIGYPHKYPEV